MTFEDLNLNTPLINALNDLDFIYPTPIQKASFAKVMSGKDIVGIAQTGTGKTFAYLLPVLRMWKFSKNMNPTIVVLVPTRELVVQVEVEVKKLTQYMNFRVLGVYGGVNMNTQAKAVYEGLDMIIGTPGRLMDLAMNGHLKFNQVNKLIIDEVDEMLNLGFRPQLQILFDKIPSKRQNIMFSATLTEDVNIIIGEYFEDVETIEIAPSGTPLEQIFLEYYKAPNFNTKLNLLNFLLSENESMSKVLIFTDSKRIADKVYEGMAEIHKENVGVIHSNKTQNARFAAVEGFENGTIKYLVATDIISRGLDIKEVSHVINFNTPDVAEDFIHRIGRTGRADADGIAITFTTPGEVENLHLIEEFIDKRIEPIELPKEVKISELLIEEEKEVIFMKNYLKPHKLKNSGGAFHEKKAKNVKTNLGGFAKKKAAIAKKIGKKYRNTR